MLVRALHEIREVESLYLIDSLFERFEPDKNILYNSQDSYVA
jgi:hypothetical protein